MTGEHSDSDRALERRSKELFDASVASLDSATRARLAAARVRALEEAERHPVRGVTWLAPAGAVGAAVAAAWLWWPASAPQPEPAVQMAVELDLLLEMELLDEFEFYDWLEEQPELVAAGDGAG